MVITTTNSIEGKPITKYLGIVTATTYTSSFNAKEISLKDIFNSKKTYEAYEKSLEAAKEDAFQKLKTNAELMKANAVVGVSVDIESLSSSMHTMISIVGTAVTTK